MVLTHRVASSGILRLLWVTHLSRGRISVDAEAPCRWGEHATLVLELPRCSYSLAATVERCAPRSKRGGYFVDLRLAPLTREEEQQLSSPPDEPLPPRPAPSRK